MVLKKAKFSLIITITSIFLLCLLMLAGLSIYLLPHFGWRIDGLRSGSMEPQLMTGDLVVTRPVEPDEVVVGDIITFRYNGEVETLVSHRVIDIEQDSPLVFRTKGDANEAPDSFVTLAKDLVGRVSFHFPLLGYAVLFLKTVTGLMVSLVIPGLVIVCICLNSIRGELVKKGNVHT